VGDGGTVNMDDEKARPGTMQTDVNMRKAKVRLGRDVQTKLGQQLRAVYDDVVNQGVPDRFSDLLQQLDNNKDKGSSS
jgi:hypothetical protein